MKYKVEWILRKIQDFHGYFHEIDPSYGTTGTLAQLLISKQPRKLIKFKNSLDDVLTKSRIVVIKRLIHTKRW